MQYTAQRYASKYETNPPTTLDAACFPASLAALSPSGIAAAAIFVMLILEVLDARIASGRRICENEENICRLSGKDSDTA